MQAMYAIKRLGATLGPLAVRPFLGDITRHNGTYNVTYQYYTHTNNSNIAENITEISDTEWLREIAMVRFGYIVLASIALVSCLLFMITAAVVRYPCAIGQPGSHDNRQKKSGSYNVTTASQLMRLKEQIYLYLIKVQQP